MPYRWTHLRKVSQGRDVGGWWPISLFRTALSAAEETVLGSPAVLVSAWLQLFQAHLSAREPRKLIWRDDLGTGTETRRAYSGLYGRYFARALLASELGFTDFIPLQTKLTNIRGGVTVTRLTNGDIPDWIAWDPQGQGYVLGEAKGRLTGNPQHYLTGTPECITTGKRQFKRVEVRDPTNRLISTRDWIAVNRWSTAHRGGQPLALLWDPPGDGESLTEEEASRHANAIRGHRLDAIAQRLGNPEYNVRIRATGATEALPLLETDGEQENPFGPFDQPSAEPYDDNYQTAVVTSFGIRPISNENDFEDALAIRERASKNDEPAMIFGLAKQASTTPARGRAPWSSENGIATTEGTALFDLKSVDIEPA